MAALLFLVAGAMQGRAQGEMRSFQSRVVPEPEENVANACEYRLRIAYPGRKIRAVLVVFERGPELQQFYEEPRLASFVQEHDLAMLMPMNCPAKDREDIDADPSHGLGRALLKAVDQLSVTTGHAELKTAPLIPVGFSGAGALVGRLVGFAPNRIAAAILSHAGQEPPLNLDTIPPSNAALKIPELILVGGKDEVVGTELAYAYFLKNWTRGALWLFATQNDANHFCNEDATELILAWLDTVVNLLGSKKGPAGVSKKSGYFAYFRKVPTGRSDHGQLPLMQATDLEVKRPSEAPPKAVSPAGYIASEAVLQSWKRFTDLPDYHRAEKPDLSAKENPSAK